MLSAGINVVTAVTPTEANSVDSQMSALLDRVEKLKTRLCVASHRPRDILVAETVQDHNRRTSPAGVIDALVVKLSNVRNPAAGSQRCRKTRDTTISGGR